MVQLNADILEFVASRQRLAETSRQIAALQLACGIDLINALALSGPARQRIVARVRRAMERERLKGSGNPCDYNLDRHIALKESLDRLCGNPPRPPAGANGNGARRRRLRQG